LNKSKTLKEIGDDLAGSAGVIYLMFLGRETYIADIQEPLLPREKLPYAKCGFFKNKENVNQAFERLQEKGEFYLRFVREEKKPGKPRFYAANMEPLFATLEGAGVKFDEGVFESLLKSLSVLSDEFPSYLVNASTLGGYMTFSPKSLTWSRTLGFYFMFLATSLYTLHSTSSNSGKAVLRETPLFRAVSAILPPSIKEPNLRGIGEILENNPNMAFDLLNVAMLLLFFDDSAREMIPSYAVSAGLTMRTSLHKEEGTRYLFYLDTFIQFNRLIMWVFMPDHLSRPKIRSKIDGRLEKMLATTEDLGNQERAQLVSDCWGSIATFWWCRELQSDGRCDITNKTCPVWPIPEACLFQPKISPLKCGYIQESLKEFLKGEQYFDYGQRIVEGRSTGIPDLWEKRRLASSA
jgi:hypothetical protein